MDQLIGKSYSQQTANQVVRRSITQPLSQLSVCESVSQSGPLSLSHSVIFKSVSSHTNDWFPFCDEVLTLGWLFQNLKERRNHLYKISLSNLYANQWPLPLSAAAAWRRSPPPNLVLIHLCTSSFLPSSCRACLYGGGAPGRWSDPPLYAISYFILIKLTW